jgi:hypothetical protein
MKSLGILATIPKLAVLMLAVFLLVVQGFVINRLAGVDYPLPPAVTAERYLVRVMENPITLQTIPTECLEQATLGSLHSPLRARLACRVAAAAHCFARLA